MKLRFALMMALLAAAILAIVPAASAQAGFVPVAPQTITIPTVPTPVTGTLTALRLTRVSQSSSGLVASGLATVTTATGTVIGSFTNQPLTAAAIPTGPNTCPILHLDVGPISLNLLGLVVTVPNHIVLDITAVSGPGNLLGNLLCAVTHLLDQTPQPLNQIVALLNQIIARL
jgi:hypothetical protein